jgi:hypothetical protein
MTSVRQPDRLVQSLKLVADLPPLSPMVRHLLATLYSQTDDIPLSQVALWIEKDTLTAGRILVPHHPNRAQICLDGSPNPE